MENKDNEKKIKRPPLMQALYAAPVRPVSDGPDERRPRRELRESEMLCVYAGPEFFENRWKKHPEEDAPVPPEDAPVPPETPEYPENYDEKDAPSETAGDAEEEAAPPVQQPPMMMTYAAPSASPKGFFTAPEAHSEEELDEETRRKLIESMSGPQMMGLVMAPSFTDKLDKRMMGVCESSLPDETPKFCPECGSKTAENANFCTNCGAKLRKTE